MEVRADPDDPGHRPDLGLEPIGCVLVRDVAVQGHDVPMDRHVHPWLIECVFDRSEAGADAIREYQIVHVLVRMPATHSVPEPVCATSEVVRTTDDPVASPTCRPAPSTQLGEQNHATGCADRECAGPNDDVPPSLGRHRLAPGRRRQGNGPNVSAGADRDREFGTLDRLDRDAGRTDGPQTDHRRTRADSPERDDLA